MHKLTIVAALLALAACSPSHANDAVQLDGLAVLEAFSGKTIQGNYADGVYFTETYHPGGNLTYQDDREADTGHWFERNGLFCTFYVKGDGACFAIMKTGENCYEMYVRENEDGIA